MSRDRVVAAPEAPVVFGSPPGPIFRGESHSPMKEPRRELHIINGPVFSSYTNRWGADCSCGWRYSNERHGIVEGMAKKHDRGEPTPAPTPVQAAHVEFVRLSDGGFHIRGWRRDL